MYFNNEFKKNEVKRIMNEIDNRKGYYDSFNYIDSGWEDFKKVIDELNDGNMETIDIQNPLCFGMTDKQYVFDVKNPQRLKKMLLSKLDEILDGADSLIDAITDLSIKSADEDDKEAIIRRVKLSELMVKLNRRNKQI